MNGNLKIVVHILFRHHTNSVELLLSLATGGQDGNGLQLENLLGQRFQVLCLYLAKMIEKLITVCTPCENPLDVSL